MLQELYIENFALIDRLHLRLGSGLTVLTGETGAGKSILIDAVEAVLGGRVSAELIRTGAERAVIEATFDVAGHQALDERLRELGLDDDDGLVVITRELNRSGRHVVRLNRRPVPASAAREVSALLVDLHGQHEHQSLLSPQRPVELLDRFGGEAVQQPLGEADSLWAAWREAGEELSALGGDERERARHIDLLRFELEEIDGAQLQVGEEENLAAELARLTHAERLQAGVAEIYAGLYEGAAGAEGAASVADGLHRAVALLRDLGRLDAQLHEHLELLEAALAQVQESARALRTYQEAIEADPERLEQLHQRQERIVALRRKYGETIADVLAYRDRQAAELERLEQAGARVAQLQAERAKLAERWREAAGRLTAAREQAATALSEQVTGELAELGLAKARLEFVVAPKGERRDAADGQAEVTAGGGDRVSIEFTANPGEVPRPLAKVASGGELARIMLALKVVTARVDGVPTLIFDEVDAGIGGRAAQAVAERLALLGATRQVLAVSHLPQIAALADQHLRVHKSDDGRRTVTQIEELDESGRVEELARMIGGSEINDLTRHHAQQLVHEGSSRRRAVRAETRGAR